MGGEERGGDGRGGGAGASGWSTNSEDGARGKEKMYKWKDQSSRADGNVHCMR